MSKPHPSTDAALILFDGDCGFCQASVRWVRRRSRFPDSAFIASDSEQAAGLLDGRFPLGAPNSVVWILGDTVLTRSDAALQILSCCSFPWNLCRFARWIPVGLRDGVYAMIARHRHRFGSGSCRIDR